MNGNQLKAACLAGGRVYGTLVASPSPKWAAELPKAGLDFVFIDSEHMPMDPQTRGWMLRCYRAMHLAPIVRIPSCTYQEAFHAVEHGAEGVVAPYIETVEEVKTLLGAVKYRPLKGERLRGALDGSIELTQKEKDYLRDYNKGLLVLLNIESRAGAENLESLLLPGVDGVLIGPHDLSINLGHPEEYGHPEFSACVKHIIETCRAKGVAVGNHSAWALDDQVTWAGWGANIIMWNSDVGRFVQGIGADFAHVRKALGDEAQGGGMVTI